MIDHIGCRRFWACSTHGVWTDWIKNIYSITPRYWNYSRLNSSWPAQVVGTIFAQNLKKFQCLSMKSCTVRYLLRICGGTGGKFLAAIFVCVCTLCKFFFLIYSTYMRNANVDILTHTEPLTVLIALLNGMQLEAYTCVRKREGLLRLILRAYILSLIFEYLADFMIAS